MEIRYPQPLMTGDIIGYITIKRCSKRARGAPLTSLYNTCEIWVLWWILVTAWMALHTLVRRSNNAPTMRMLLDPKIKAVVPPWGGVTAIDILPHLDFEAISAAEPTWIVGYPDISTLIAPLTLLTGNATIHGGNLMDTPYRVPDSFGPGLMSLHYLLVTLSSSLHQAFTESTTGMTGAWSQKPPNMHGTARELGSAWMQGSMK